TCRTSVLADRSPQSTRGPSRIPDRSNTELVSGNRRNIAIRPFSLCSITTKPRAPFLAEISGIRERLDIGYKVPMLSRHSVLTSILTKGVSPTSHARCSGFLKVVTGISLSRSGAKVHSISNGHTTLKRSAKSLGGLRRWPAEILPLSYVRKAAPAQTGLSITSH